MKEIIIVGSGFSGSVCARELAENGYNITLLEKNNHIGGNAYDIEKNGIIVQEYGPHIFHTSIKEVFEYLSKYTQWFKFEHRVKANIYGKFIPVPFNLSALYKVFDEKKAKELEQLLIENYGMNKKVPIMQMKESENQKLSDFADFVFKNVFLFYTQKQWGRKIEELDPAILTRVPVYISNEDRYFTDTYQFQPKEGFTKIFENLLNHKNIKVILNTDAKNLIKIENNKIYYKDKEFNGDIIYTGQVDELLNNKFGKLPYRSLKFEFENYNIDSFQPAPVINYTVDKDYTRISEFKKFTTENPPSGKTIIIKEYSLEYEQNKNMIPYYPIPNPDNNKLFEKYANYVSNFNNFHLLGRLGNYKYINMDIAVKNALDLSNKIIARDSH